MRKKMEVFADYHKQRDSFNGLLQPDCKERILLYKGKSGVGKTSLIMVCQRNVCEGVYLVPVQLRGEVVNVAEIFSRTGEKIGWNNLPRFIDRLDYFSHHTNIQFDKTQQKGMNNKINVALNADNPEDKKEHRVRLTESWFEDVKRLNENILIVMDTYEKATQELKDWISGPFLSRTATTNNVRVALAGQEVPDNQTIEWGHCSKLYELYGVKDAIHWMPVVKSLNKTIPFENQMDWLAGVCHALKGQPKEIINIIKGLPEAH